MAVSEVLVRRAAAGNEVRVGAIVGTRGKSARFVPVRWRDGDEERVRLDPVTDRIVVDGSVLLEWLLDPAPLIERFNRDAHSVFVDLIRDSRGAGLSTMNIKKTLTGLGIAESVVRKAWGAAQPTFKRHAHIVTKGATYAWTDTPRDPHADVRAMRPVEALDRLVKGRVPADEKPILVEVIRTGLVGGSGPATILAGRMDSRDEAVHAAALRAVQDQKVRARGVRAFADLAMEVEELVANGAGADILISRVRDSASAQDLTPIESAGGTTSFDRRRHSPIIGSLKDGVRVTVVRPGYSWRTAEDDVLVAKALVIEQ